MKIPFDDMSLKRRENIEFYLFAIMAVIVTSYTLVQWYDRIKDKQDSKN